MTIPAFNLRAERYVLGCPMFAGTLSAEAGHRIFDRASQTGLKAGHFYLWSHEALWTILQRQRAAAAGLDPVSIGHAITSYAQDELGGLMDLLEFHEETMLARLAEIAHEPAAFSNVGPWARIVVDEYRRRQRPAA